MIRVKFQMTARDLFRGKVIVFLDRRGPLRLLVAAIGFAAGYFLLRDADPLSNIFSSIRLAIGIYAGLLAFSICSKRIIAAYQMKKPGWLAEYISLEAVFSDEGVTLETGRTSGPVFKWHDIRVSTALGGITFMVPIGRRCLALNVDNGQARRVGLTDLVARHRAERAV